MDGNKSAAGCLPACLTCRMFLYVRHAKVLLPAVLPLDSVLTNSEQLTS